MQLSDATVRFEVRGFFSGVNKCSSLHTHTHTTPRTQLWDTAGQERYRSLAPMYYRGASAAVVVFDVTSRDSYEGAKSWVKELQRRGEPNVVIALAGNKADAPREKRALDAAEVREYATEAGCLYMDTSAKTGHNVKEIFVAVAKKLPRAVRDERDDLADLSKPPPAKASGGGCCGGGPRAAVE